MTFDFWEALKHLLKWKKLARAGWNGKDMFVYYVPQAMYPTTTEPAVEMFWKEVEYWHYLAMKTVTWLVVCWSIDTTSALATDWYVVE